MIDILFFSRTKSKLKLFNEFSQKLKNYSSEVFLIRKLPKGQNYEINKEDLSTIIKKFIQENFNGINCPNFIKKFFEFTFSFYIRYTYKRVYTIISKNKPRLIILWNGQKYQDDIIHTVNKKFHIPIGYFEKGVLPKTLAFNFQGINSRCDLPRDPDFYQKKSNSLTKEKNIQTKNINKKLPKNFILVIFQKERDSQIISNSPWIKDMESLFFQCINALNKSNRQDLHLIFRQHPGERNNFKKLHKFAAKKINLHFDNSNLEEIIKQAQAIITINSSVSIQALILKKKVIVLGDAFYNIPKITLSASQFSELIKAINNIDCFIPNQQIIANFIDYVKKKYLIKDYSNLIKEINVKISNFLLK